MFSLFSLNPRISSTWFFYLQLGHSEIYHDILGYIGISLTNLTSPMAHLPNHSLKFEAPLAPASVGLVLLHPCPVCQMRPHNAPDCSISKHASMCWLTYLIKRQLSFEQYLFNYVNWNSSLLQMSSHTARTPIYIRCFLI